MKKTKHTSIFSTVIVVVVVLILLFTRKGSVPNNQQTDNQNTHNPDIADTLPQENDAQQNEDTDSPDTALGEADQDDLESIDPAQENNQTDQSGENGSDDATPILETSVCVGENERVEDSFFEDAAFIGNSLVEGLRLYSGLTTCDYYSATSLSVPAINSNYCITLENGSAGTVMQGLAQHTYGKVYVLLGINEIGYDTSYFIELYGEMLDQIREIQPDADIYIMSLTPVSKAKSDSSSTFNMTRVKEYNSALLELAEEKDCWYLDLCSALAGPDGYLPSESTSDGVHFSVSVYQTWVEYLRTHYV